MFTQTPFYDYHLHQHWSLTFLIIGIITTIYLASQRTKSLIEAKPLGLIIGFISAILLALWMGSRHPSHYGDCLLYFQMFDLVQRGEWYALADNPAEWLWTVNQMYFIKHSTITEWYISVALFYILGIAIALAILTPRRFLIPFIFIVTSFSFFTYGTNGIRNGMATSIALVGIALISKGASTKNIGLVFGGFIVMYLSTAVHQSLLLILATAVIALCYRNTKVYMIGWFLCILISLFATGSLVSLFSFFSGDERMSFYGTGEVSTTMFSKTGFRWDFILYSSLPIALGWYVVIKKQINDQGYIFLLNLYTIANAFWCTINSVAYSNRFAYLSWFFLPLLIAYPLVKYNLCKRQGLIAGGFMLFFTVFNLIFGG